MISFLCFYLFWIRFKSNLYFAKASIDQTNIQRNEMIMIAMVIGQDQEFRTQFRSSIFFSLFLSFEKFAHDCQSTVNFNDIRDEFVRIYLIWKYSK